MGYAENALVSLTLIRRAGVVTSRMTEEMARWRQMAGAWPSPRTSIEMRDKKVVTEMTRSRLSGSNSPQRNKLYLSSWLKYQFSPLMER